MIDRAAHGAPFPDPPWHSLAVLAVDDEVLLRNLVELTLRAQGAGVMTAACAEEALAVMADADKLPDLIITDLEMPGIGGIGLIRAVRSHLVLGQIPILVVSGSQDGNVPLAEGANGFLRKPYRRHELLLAASRSLAGA